MKIGIVTIYNGNNFGAYLQAYALKKYLGKQGNSVYHIKINKDSEAKVYFYRWVSKRWLKGIPYAFRYLKYGRKKYKYFKTAWKEFSVVNTDTSFDAVILGSDEIWNVNNTPFKNPLFYGIGLRANKTIAYAPSIGSYDAVNVPDYVKNAVNDLSAVLVRDDATKKYAEEFTDKSVNIVCDPTLLYDFENQTLPKCDDDYIEKNKYILIYAYTYTENEKKWIRKYADKKGLKIVTTGFYEEWCDHCVNCSPLCFLDVIKKAEIVYTSSFHCGIFSMYAGKRMIVKGTKQKVSDLFRRIGVENVLINVADSYEKFEEVANAEIDFKLVMENIYNFRKVSQKFLKEALER